jgi:hypothetical protein
VPGKIAEKARQTMKKWFAGVFVPANCNPATVYLPVLDDLEMASGAMKDMDVDSSNQPDLPRGKTNLCQCPWEFHFDAFRSFSVSAISFEKGISKASASALAASKLGLLMPRSIIPM